MSAVFSFFVGRSRRVRRPSDGVLRARPPNHNILGLFAEHNIGHAGIILFYCRLGPAYWYHFVLMLCTPSSCKHASQKVYLHMPRKAWD